MLIRKNCFYDSFRCLAQDCPDSCCQLWDVEIDPRSKERYLSLDGDLGRRLKQTLVETDSHTYMALEAGRCPMWRDDGLCRIQAELGADALCKTCEEFPRLTHDYGDFIELTLELSCPEVARLLLTQPWETWKEEILPEDGTGEYDCETMKILLESRKTAFSLLAEPRPVGERLALVYLYAHHIQNLLDVGEDTPFCPDTSLAFARELAHPTQPETLLSFFWQLEMLSPNWKKRLSAPCPSPWTQVHVAFLRYGIERYWLQAVSDYDLICRIKAVLLLCLGIKTLGGNAVETAQQFSKEVENSAENLESLWDAAYSNPAFTDDKLLWLLLHWEVSL